MPVTAGGGAKLYVDRDGQFVPIGEIIVLPATPPLDPSFRRSAHMRLDQAVRVLRGALPASCYQNLRVTHDGGSALLIVMPESILGYEIVVELNVGNVLRRAAAGGEFLADVCNVISSKVLGALCQRNPESRP